jgi:hypothetical protein
VSAKVGDREASFRAALITYFPMGIAVLSLITSIFSSYLSLRSLEFFESSLGRTEYLHTCKEIIADYFEVIASRAGKAVRPTFAGSIS